MSALAEESLMDAIAAVTLDARYRTGQSKEAEARAFSEKVKKKEGIHYFTVVGSPVLYPLSFCFAAQIKKNNRNSFNFG